MATIRYDTSSGIHGTTVLKDIEKLSEEIDKLKKRAALQRWKKGKVKIKSN